MSQHARVEELSDSDPEEVDISSLVRTGSQRNASSNNSTLMQGGQIPTQNRSQVTRENSKDWQCLYPVYFDASRTRAEGRRVSSSLAVPNPLAREIADAVFSLNLQPAVEPEKIHPKDWANPGRVRVLIKRDGKALGRSVKNKHDLFIKVATYLQAHPTNEKSPLRLKIVGMPESMEKTQPPAVPKGWKMNSILPLHSPALSGGGVSENLFKEMMEGMQGGQGEQAAVQGGKKKKVKG